MPLLTNHNPSFLPALPTAQSVPNTATAAAVAAAAMLNVARSNPYNDSPLEFKTKQSIVPTNANHIDLDERDGHLRLLDTNFKSQQPQQQQQQQQSQTSHDLSDTNGVLGDIKEPAAYSAIGKSFAQNDVMFNAGLGTLAQPPGFMMMPSVMNILHDPSALLSMSGLPGFPTFNALATSKVQTIATEPPAAVVSSTAATITADLSPNSTVVPKETIVYKSCILIPPFKNAPAPTTRERPSGCRTVFVGGLPENITEDIIREVFERCGEITTLRLSKKNFCHVRFIYEASVDSAIYLSGYRIRIGGLTDAANCSRLHVDFAQARDDQYEWECKQRQLQREQRHRQRNEQDRLRPLSPVIIHFTDMEAANVAERLKSDDFSAAIQTLITWLERGDCNKKNANTIYSMIQSINAHVRRLMNDKSLVDEELRKAQEQFNKQMTVLNTQCKFDFILYFIYILHIA